MAETRQARAAAAAGAAFLGLDQGLGEGGVHLPDQAPAALVAHAEAGRGGGQRPGFVDRLEEVGLARPEATPGRSTTRKRRPWVRLAN